LSSVSCDRLHEIWFRDLAQTVTQPWAHSTGQSSISSRYGSQALPVELRPGCGSAAVIAPDSETESVITSMAGFAGTRRPQTAGRADRNPRSTQISADCLPPNVYFGFDPPQ
jgi:hypothetical protein